MTALLGFPVMTHILQAGFGHPAPGIQTHQDMKPPLTVFTDPVSLLFSENLVGFLRVSRMAADKRPRYMALWVDPYPEFHRFSPLLCRFIR
jgi:hypothetical protein